MKRRLVNVLTFVSLPMLAATAVFWVRSHRIGDRLWWYDRPSVVQVDSNDGLLRVEWGDMVSREAPMSPGWGGTFWPFERVADTYKVDLKKGITLGFRYQRWTWNTPEVSADGRRITFPYWVPALVLSVPVVAGAIRYGSGRRRARRIDRGRCGSCGYDLTGNTSGVCPECSTPGPLSSAR
jgi:hypothetical protein